MDVGERLKAVRTARGLSQRQLAARAGVTNGMISMIEQNRTSPSIASLQSILRALPMSFSEFFSAEDADSEKVFYGAEELQEINPARIFGDKTGATVSDLSLRQVGDASRHSLQLLHERYEPGSDTGKELYSHEGEEGGIVVSGEIEITVGRQCRVLGPGDAYLFDSRMPHRFRNTGREPCIIISACTPPTF